MGDQNLTEEAPTPKRRGRGCLLWLGGFALVGMGLLLAGAVYESVAEAADERDYPPPGQLVDVGGYELHLNCTGTGSPTVVIEAGWGDWSTTWGHVQSEVAETSGHNVEIDQPQAAVAAIVTMVEALRQR